MKNGLLCFLLSVVLQPVWAQVAINTAQQLEPQHENEVGAETVAKVENIGRNINSSLAELRPTVSADGNLLFFICENHPYNTKYNSIRNSQDIWYSERDSTGNWSEAIHMEYPLNTYYYNAVFWISPDNNSILIRNAFINGQYAGNGVSMSHRKKDGTWSKPQALWIRNYEKYDRGRQNGASMSQDGQVLLLYMSEEIDSYNNDIYVSFPLPDDSWSEPKSLGKKINLKKYNEMTPYLAADGKTLYFSSDRPGGLGDNDIWRTKRLDDSWQNWTEPVNMGSPINTPDWDAFFSMDGSGEFAYMSTHLNSLGSSDIVRIRLMEKETSAPLLVSGKVYNSKTGQPISASLVYETLPGGTVACDGLSNPADGSFSIALPYRKTYSIRASADKFYAFSESLNLDSLEKAGQREIHKDLYLFPIEVGQVFRLNNVFFDFDKWNLRPASYLELERVVKLLNENPSIAIEISAHTDSRGADEYNFKLSENRAWTVMRYILSRGIAPDRIHSQGYGKTKPVVPNNSDENRQLNRRVEFKILKN